MSAHFEAIRKNRHEADETYTGPGGMICPKCGYGVLRMFDCVRRGEHRDVFDMHCWKCGADYKLSSWNIIDPNITRAIIRLNQKGYKTDFSCEGHSDDSDSGGHAYIKFKDISLKSILTDHPLPEPWFLGIGGVDKYSFTIRANQDKCSEEDWDERCERITKWVYSLPIISDDKTFKYGWSNR